MTTAKSLQALVQDFFVQHLAVERNASPNTVGAYRDAIKLFLRHAATLRACSPDQLDDAVLEVNVVRSFLDWLRSQRGCSARTRNHRLAALKSFARYVALVAPEHLERCRRIRELPPASFEPPEIRYLDEDEIVQLITSVKTSTAQGRRDRALLLLLYNTGARVQELANLNVGDAHSQTIAFVRLLGKGRKARTCPLWSRCWLAIQQMLRDRDAADDAQPLFLSDRGKRLSRSGITYLLRRAQNNCALHPRQALRLSPHVLRHTTAMHLLQSGVDITTIAAWLGHAHLTTTHGYVEIDLRMKQAALADEAALPQIRDGEYPTPDVIDWLEQLTRRCSYAQRPDPTAPRQPAFPPPVRITSRRLRGSLEQAPTSVVSFAAQTSS